MEQKVMLRAKNISKIFFGKDKDVHAVDDVSIDVKENEFLVILGPGHCGKSVFINTIAGLEEPTTGTVEIDGVPVKGCSNKTAIVFQKTGIMFWKTTMQNVELGLKYAHVNKKKRREIAQKNIDLVGLHGFEKSYPSQLSGGMKQRVGIARAYTADPDVLLMDEPFGALDAQTRYSMQEEILRIWEQNKRTVIFITNNIEEAVYLGDRIILFSQRPARVKAEYSLAHLPRPRDVMSKEFLEMRELIESNADLALQ